MTDFRALPSVEQLLQTKLAAELVARYGRPLTLNAIRATLDQLRSDITEGSEHTLPGREILLRNTQKLLDKWFMPTLQPVINATGVIIHTNLGRAPLSQETIEAMEKVSRGYSTLEYQLSNGKRGTRLIHAEALLTRLTGAKAAVVVNNNAAAVLLTLTALTKRRRVVIARSQLVEIGGGFRIPDVMKQSGAKLVEVGSTNKVHLSEYEQAIAEAPVGLVMRVHRSNFRIIGFTEEPRLEDIAAIAHKNNIPILDDLGSGTFLNTEKYGLNHEPTVIESLTAGADIVCFSGDKLLGGPQAGIIIGREDLLKKIRTHPLARAVRADKTCLAGLSATLYHYLKDEAENKIPIWRMISYTPKQIKARAAHWMNQIGAGEIISGESTVGGGSLPGESLPTNLLAFDVKHTEKFLSTLRQQQPAIIARTENDRILLDPRTVLAEQEGALLVGLKNALGKNQ